MKYLHLILCLCLFSVARAASPTKASIETLLVVTEVEKLLGSMYEQMDGMMKNGMAQALRGQDVPMEAREFADSFRKKMITNFREELSWSKMKEIYVGIYSETFTQEEIDGLITFYEGPAGKAFIAKMPLVMQKSMTAVQQMMGPMMQKMQQSMQEAAREIESIKQKKG